ncbi:MAG TPA: LacI family DNA-binding transcriptional regulator [Eubacteriales bacterium]|nr:LacI family DNA-binding transcriptional regulator [Eubacteriales bacterium]
MPKMRDIAEKTGLNISTVSRALRDAPDISPETASLVKRTAMQMGYRPRISGRSSATVGLIVPEVGSHYYSEMVETVERELKKSGYSMIVAIGGFDVGGILAAFDEMLHHDVCGMIVNDCFMLDAKDDIQKHDRIAHSVLPLVLISENKVILPVDTISIANEMAVRQALDHLIDLGHREIGYIGEFASDVRYLALMKYLRELGLPVREKHMKRGRERFELGGYLRAKELIQEKDEPRATAVLACYDQVALGALDAFSEAGIRVPEDISIVGFDNIILNDYLPIQLTSISNPTEQLSALAVKLLMDNLHEKENHVVQNVSLQPRLVVRNSTAAPRNDRESTQEKEK